MDIENNFELLVDVVFTMSNQLGGIEPKPEDLVISFHLWEKESLQEFHIWDLQAKTESYMLNDKTGQKNLTDKYIMEISKLNHLQLHIPLFELEYRKFKHKIQRHKFKNIFSFTMEEEY